MPRPNQRTMTEYQSLYGFALEQARAGGSSEEIEALRQEMAARGRADLHFFCYQACGFLAMTPPSGLHGRLCSFLEGAQSRKWVECFRGALKSTISTVGLSLQAVVKDPDEHVLIVSAFDPLSKTFVRQIKDIAESESFQWLYPEIRPNKKKWSDEEAYIQRPRGAGSAAREPSWKAGSVKKGLTGGHHTRIHYDDLVVWENVTSRLDAESVYGAFLSWRFLLDEWGTPEVMVGTPYTDYDLYARLKREHQGMFRRFVVPALDETTGELAWPEEYPLERLEELKRADYVTYMAQMQLNPLPPGMQTFKQATFRYWRGVDEPETEFNRHAVVVDPARLVCYMGVDPGTGVQGGDETAIVVVGVDETRHYYVLDVKHGLMDAPEMLAHLFANWDAFRIERTWLEMAGPFASLAATLAAEMEARHRYHFVEKAAVGNEPKGQRIRLTLGPWYAKSLVYHHWSHRNAALEEQLMRFPKAAHDDVADALAYAMRLGQDYGYSGAPRDDQVAENVASGFGNWTRILYTAEERAARLGKRMGRAAEGAGRIPAYGIY